MAKNKNKNKVAKKEDDDKILEELEEISIPVREFLIKNFNPHCSILIQDNRVDVVERTRGLPFKKIDEESLIIAELMNNHPFMKF